MKNFFPAFLLLLVSSLAWATAVTNPTTVTSQSASLHQLKAVYDFAVLGGASPSTVNLKDKDGRDAAIPSGAVIKQVIIDGVTSPVSAGGGTISLGAETTVDLKAALAATSYTGLVAGIPVSTAATMVKTTAKRVITATIASSAVTAGKFNVWIDYYY